MSYKIVGCAIVKNVNKAYTINLRPPEASSPISTAMTASDHPRCKLPDPWLLDSESLLHELARVRELALRIPPVRNDIVGPINSVIDALWDLEERLRYCLHLHCAGQRAFARQHDKKLAKPKKRSQHGRAAPHAIIATRRSKSI